MQKQFVITDDTEALIGMRLAGVEGEVVSPERSLQTILDEKLNDSSIGIVMIAPKLIRDNQNYIDDIRFNRSTPLIVNLYGPDEYQKESHSVSETIRRAIGISL